VTEKDRISFAAEKRGGTTMLWKAAKVMRLGTARPVDERQASLYSYFTTEALGLA
jgi:hypothetical protein